MLESSIQTSIVQYLKSLEDYGQLVYQRNNTGKRGGVKYGKKGSPDLYIFLKNGKTLHVELKNKTSKQRESQIIFQKKIERLGHEYYIIRSLDELQKLLKSY